ncbi:TrmB family transcriptional regulator [Methanothermobacter sp. THM-2]|uniref:TrmB family transcriptional regulator n=1 Tax=Methanothermobacter sp. THM-2 TaxID=2606912 RepID=UPI0013651D96|nr:TrmB family transcriptional regulator [Methanothermobacter sp. THM-2]QHN07597.1 TrmB family transcriptional regulator [Methanothermobacter sp. THM-2]
MERKVMKALKLMGLTDYQAAAYTTMVSLVSAGASEAAKASGIPRSRIYEVLRQLSERGFVEVERGKPLRYHVVPPAEVFRREKRRIMKELDEAMHQLRRTYEDQVARVPAPVWLIHGQEKIMKKELEIISRTRSELKMRMGFIFRGEMRELRPAIERIVDRGAGVRIMAPEDLDLPCEVRVVSMPPVRMFVRDSGEMMWIFSRFTPEGAPIPETAMGIWNQYPEIAENYSRIFDSIWYGKSDGEAGGI